MEFRRVLFRSGARAAQQTQQDSLGLIIAVMRQQYGLHATLIGKLPERRIPGVARSRLPANAGRRTDLDTQAVARQPNRMRPVVPVRMPLGGNNPAERRGGKAGGRKGESRW